MKEAVDKIAEDIIKSVDSEGVIFARSDKVDNLMQIIYEERVTVDDIDAVVTKVIQPNERKKYLLYFANELVSYLAAKLVKSRLKGVRSAPVQPKEPQKKLSKSEQFLERKKREALEKSSQENDSKGGSVEKIGLKEIGQDIREREEKMKELEAKRQEQLQSTEEEHKKHTSAYGMAFSLFAHVVEVTTGDGKEVSELCEFIKQIGDPDITRRQIALGKMAKNPRKNLATDALVAALRDKNIIIPVIETLRMSGERKAIRPLINLIKEYPTPKDILFRGPAEQAIGETIRLMNEKEKNAGTKYLYQVCNNPKFEPLLTLLGRVIIRDIKDSSVRQEYFTPQCLKMISMIAGKLAEKKKKKVKVGFVNMTVQSDLSKMLLEVAEAAA